MHCLATFLDPRFKHKFTTEPEIFLAQIIAWIQQEYEKDGQNEPNEPELLDVASPIAKRPCTSQSFFDDVAEIGNMSAGYLLFYILKNLISSNNLIF